MPGRFLTLRQTARALKCSLPTVRKAVHTGQLRAVRVAVRVVRVPAQALADLARGNGKPARRRRPRKTVAT